MPEKAAIKNIVLFRQFAFRFVKGANQRVFTRRVDHTTVIATPTRIARVVGAINLHNSLVSIHTVTANISNIASLPEDFTKKEGEDGKKSILLKVLAANKC